MKRFAMLMILLSLALFMINCENEDNPSIWDPKDEGEPSPVISSVEPATQQYGGVGTKKLVTINGDNFHTDVSKNFVYFGKVLGDVVECSASQIKVAAPANYADDLKIEVHSHGAYLPAVYGGADNPTLYTLIPAERRIGMYDAYTPPEGVCVDGEGNLFITSAKAVDKIHPDGTVIESAYQLKSKFTKLIQVGPENSLYYSWTKYIFRTDTTTGDDVYANAKFNIYAMDFDENQNLFIVGSEQIAHVNYSDMEVTELEVFEDTNFLGCKVYNGELYLIAKYFGTEEGVSTAPYLCKIGLNSDGTLDGDLQVIQDFTGTGYEDMFVTQLLMNNEGKAYIATNNYSLLELVNGSLSPVYPSILGEYSIYNIAWGTGEEIFVNTNNEEDDSKIKVLGVMLFEESAPYYGRD